MLWPADRYASLFNTKPQCVNACVTEVRMFQEKRINTMAADALAPYVARLSVAMVLTMWYISGFKISLVWSSETSKNDSRTSGIPAGLVRRTTAYFWFSHKLHWLYIFQISEWYIRTNDFYNPLARWTSAFNLKFRSLYMGIYSLPWRQFMVTYNISVSKKYIK